MGKRRKFECDICGEKVPEEFLEHLRVFHPEDYSFKKMEFIENAVIIGLDSVAAYKTIKKMSGEDVEKAISEAKLEKKIPRTYNYIKDIYQRKRAKKWYMRKLLLDARSKSLIRIVTKHLKKYTNINSTEKIAINLVDRYSKKRIRSCYDERIIALSALIAACNFIKSDLDLIKIKDLVLKRDIDPKEMFNILNWMEKQLIPDHEYVNHLLGIT
ncbi:MAG: hypothetical protein ACXADY_15095 [Candidatus Hodarchaeales archaeon]